jgi:hypothetical protein
MRVRQGRRTTIGIEASATGRKRARCVRLEGEVHWRNSDTQFVRTSEPTTYNRIHGESISHNQATELLAGTKRGRLTALLSQKGTNGR